MTNSYQNILQGLKNIKDDLTPQGNLNQDFYFSKASKIMSSAIQWIHESEDVEINEATEQLLTDSHIFSGSDLYLSAVNHIMSLDKKEYYDEIVNHWAKVLNNFTEHNELMQKYGYMDSNYQIIPISTQDALHFLEQLISIVNQKATIHE